MFSYLESSGAQLDEALPLTYHTAERCAQMITAVCGVARSLTLNTMLKTQTQSHQKNKILHGPIMFLHRNRDLVLQKNNVRTDEMMYTCAAFVSAAVCTMLRPRGVQKVKAA